MRARRSVNGAIAGGVAAAAWAAVEPADRRAFGVEYSDVEVLGKLVTRGDRWPAAGLALHVANGAAFGAAYAQLKPFVPGPAPARAVLVAVAECFGTWPLSRFISHHPAADDFPRLWGNRRALVQATFRHALFGLILGLLEERLNADPGAEPPSIPVSSNGHGDLATAVTVGQA
jgi:hypothetical protein